ncbi:MAG: MOP flippase family protein [Burkholderiales bacterium]|nr:MOP flippase family protein [Burkholderiales bacterium]
MSESRPSGDLGIRATRGVLWTGAGQILRQVVQIVGSIVLARLLAPNDFGLLGMAMFFVGIGQLFADFGIGSAIVHARSEDRIVLSSCFWLNVAVASVLALVLLGASPLIADFYRRPDLTSVVAVLALNLMLAGLQVVPQALLFRDMRFGDLARAQVLGSLAGAIVAIAFAWLGAGVWALVAQPLVGSTVALLISMAALSWRPRFEFSWPLVEPLARFSFALLGTNLVGYANRNVDSLLVGRFLGASALGLYSMAIQLMLYPLQQVSSVIVRVLFPTLVQIRGDLPRFRSAYLRAVGAIAVVAFPMMGGLFAVADDFVTVVFGPGWIGMTPVLRVLSWVGMLQSVGTTVGVIYLATGRPAIALRVTVVAAPLLIGGMAAGLPWGILGVAIGYAAASLLLFYYSAGTAFGLVYISLRELHEVVYRPLLSTLVMVGAVTLTKSMIPDVPTSIRLAIAVTSGVVAYVALSLLLNRRQLMEIFALVKSAAGRAGA